jgi:hypothetical protein
LAIRITNVYSGLPAHPLFVHVPVILIPTAVLAIGAGVSAPVADVFDVAELLAPVERRVLGQETSSVAISFSRGRRDPAEPATSPAHRPPTHS